jgi:actin-like ATPase involved in cell morphogenesis
VAYDVGIDLGTTYTAAAVGRDGQVDMASLGIRGPVIPSVLFARPEGGFLVGEAAASRATRDPSRIAREFKRRIGDPTPLILGGDPHSAEDLTAELLRWTVARIAEAEGGPARRVVVSHPANWGLYKKQRLGDAVRGADVDRATLVSEPEAAAIHYTFRQRVPRGTPVAVYDLGGGTFDAVVLRQAEAGWNVLGAPEGIERLGGIDLDEAIFHQVVERLDGALDALDPDDATARAAVSRLRDDCVRAKEALSTDTEVAIPVFLPTVQTTVRLTRGDFEAMARPAVAETIAALGRALDSAGVRAPQLGALLLVGGSSRIPLVADMVSRALGRPVAVDAHPKHGVALGAALLAAGPTDALLAAGPADVRFPPSPATAAPPAPVLFLSPAGETSPGPVAGTGSTGAPGRGGRGRRSRRGWIAVAGLVVAVLVAAVIVLTSRPGESLPEAAPGYLEVLESARETGPELDAPGDGRLRGRTFDLRIERFGTADGIAIHEGRSMSAPAPGERWLVVDVLCEALTNWGPSGGGPPTFALVVDDRRISLDDMIDPCRGRGRRVTVAASVPEDADALALVAAEAGLEQTWSVPTGERAADAAAVLDREAPLEAQLDQEQALTVAFDLTAPGPR